MSGRPQWTARQEREFQRLGGTRTLKANIRVIAATNRDLRKAVARGAFREDLFYRLQVFDIAIARFANAPTTSSRSARRSSKSLADPSDDRRRV